jgi:hypothetical protein
MTYPSPSAGTLPAPARIPSSDIPCRIVAAYRVRYLLESCNPLNGGRRKIRARSSLTINRLGSGSVYGIDRTLLRLTRG